MPTITKILFQNSDPCRNLISVLQVMLEQGNPISQSISDTFHFRWVTGCLLLMGIVLSNAYKSTNIYNIVVPRKPILYNFLNELVRDNFQVYTRSIGMFLERGHLYEYGRVVLDIVKNGHSIIVRTELQSTILDYYNVLKYYVEDSGVVSTLEKLRVMDVAKLHPNVAQAFSEFLTEKFAVNKEILEIPGMVQVLRQFKPEMQSMEGLILRKSVENCPKVALILPDYLCKN